MLDAYNGLPSGLGSYDWLRLAEVDLMIRLGDTEEKYSHRPTNERARMIAALKIPEMRRALAEEDALKKVKADTKE